MQKITFTKTSILCSTFDQTNLGWIDRDIADSQLPISWYLPYTVKIEEDVTLRDVLTLLSAYTDELNFMFVNYLKTIPYEKLVSVLIESDDIEHSNEIDSICLLLAGQIKEIEDSETLLITQPRLMAFEIIDEDRVDDDDLYSVLEISVKQLLDTQFILDELVEYYDDVNPDDEPFSGLVDWTLFQFISGLFSELAVYALIKGLMPGVENLAFAPLTVSQLFEHLEELDQYYLAQKPNE